MGEQMLLGERPADGNNPVIDEWGEDQKNLPTWLNFSAGFATSVKNFKNLWDEAQLIFHCLVITVTYGTSPDLVNAVWAFICLC